MKSYLDGRMELIKKMDKDGEYKPSPEELEKAYGYLSYCLECGEELTLFEPYTHGCLGNRHKFGCKSYQRIFGVMLNFPAKLVLTVLAFLSIPFFIIYLGVREFLKEINE